MRSSEALVVDKHERRPIGEHEICDAADELPAFVIADRDFLEVPPAPEESIEEFVKRVVRGDHRGWIDLLSGKP